MGNLGPKGECIPHLIRTLFDHMSKALKVPGMVGMSRIWGHSKPHILGQTTSEVAKNWCPVSGFGPKLTVEFEAFFRKKFGVS